MIFSDGWHRGWDFAILTRLGSSRGDKLLKYLFACVLLALIGASILTARWMPDALSEVPAIYWVTDANPARQEQVKLFHQWLVDQGHFDSRTFADAKAADAFFKRNTAKEIRRILREVNPEAKSLFDWAEDRQTAVTWPVTIRVPKAQLKLDMANADRTKKVIQGVSGVAGDVQDQGAGSDLRYFRNIGLNTDVTADAARLGFDMSNTYAALEAELTLRDASGVQRQYQFPCNVNAPLYFVNKATFRQYGQPIPPKSWTIDEFENAGYAFVQAANRGLGKQLVFFANGVDFEVIRRTYGGSRYNETGTAAALDDATLQAMRKLHEWTFGKDGGGLRLLPNAGDRASFTTESGYGGADAQLFSHDDRSKGQFGMFWTGRYLLIQFREIDKSRASRGLPKLDMTVVAPPHAIFPNTSISTRAAMVYSQGKHQDLAVLFLAFLASKEYNDQIVKDGDALPPNPAYTKSEAFNRPPDFPTEWEVHEPFATGALELAVGSSYSPFILQPVADRIENNWRDKYMNNLMSAEDAMDAAAREINYEITRKLEEDKLRDQPVLAPLYEKLTARQQQIDALKAKLIAHRQAGRAIPEEDKIPADWIENAFHLAYYKHLGWLKEAEPATRPTTQPELAEAK
jgi:multiple sugar transport system substrate-binding protein